MTILLLACRPSPPEAEPAADTAVDDTAVDDTAAGDTAEDTAQDTDPPSYCPQAAAGMQEVTDTPASPYFVRHPAVPDAAAPAVVYLPGGPGDRTTAEVIDRLYFGGGVGLEDFRVAILYTDGNRNFSVKYDRAAEVRDELLACWGGDAARVHLGGTSNGGIGSFALLSEAPDGWASLLGAPGGWQTFDADAVAAAIGTRPVYMGVGALDDGWLPTVQEQAEDLAARGVDVTFAAWEGQSHVVDEAFDEGVFFEFWRSP